MIKKWTYETCLKLAKECTSKSEFCKRNSGAYQVAWKNGWLKDYTWFKYPTPYNKKWTYEVCREEAQKYRTSSEFLSNNKGAYKAAIKNGWIYEWFTLRKPRNYWHKETCFQEAQKYRTKGEFSKKSPSAYNAARENGWLNNYDFFEETSKTPKKPNGYWDCYETCFQEAQKYKTKRDFYNGNHSAYRAAIKNKWIDTWFENLIKGSGFWNRERCYEVAKECKSRSEFKEKYSRAYAVAYQNGYIDEYTWFKRRIHTDDEYLIYTYEDKDNKTVYVGLTLMNRLSLRHSEHKHDNDVVTNYFESINKNLPDPIIKINHLTQTDAQYYENLYAKEYESNGWRLLNISKMGVGFSSVGGGNIIWEYDNTKKEAEKYKTRNEFRKKCGGAYSAAKRNGWLNEWFGKYEAKPTGYWTKEKCLEEGKKYRTRSEFAEKCSSAYNVARENGWLEDINFVKLKKPVRYWTYDRCKEEAAKYRIQYDFKKNCSAAFNVAYKNGWLKDYNFEEGKKTNGYWKDYEHCKEAASKCRTRKEFGNKNGAAYDWSRKNGWINEFFPR